MNSTSNVVPSVDEIISTLQRTSLPTIVVEGTDDMIVYRRLEDRLNSLGVSVFPAGGRINVLEIFRRKSEISARVKLAFIADQDTWINTGVPNDYQHPHLVLTHGYSIENDVFIDGNLISLLNDQEFAKFSRDLQLFVEWYSLALTRHLNGSDQKISLHPDQVLDPAKHPVLKALFEGEQYPEVTRQQVFANYQRLLRGKSLFALLLRHTNYKGRQVRHTDKALMELVAARPGPLLQLVSDRVAAAFG